VEERGGRSKNLRRPHPQPSPGPRSLPIRGRHTHWRRCDHHSQLGPFYTEGDADDGSGEIIIPQRVLQSFLNNASQTVPKAIPGIAAKGLTFIGVKVDGGFLRTGKTIADAQTFGRFVKMEESNQRSWSVSKYIIDFTATGSLLVDETIIKVDDLRKLLEYAGRYIGIGSARPQGYGRFNVLVWQV
jgi:hypothetical protein